MNISKPVASSLESVEFTFLTADEIHAISARRIENDQTFDNLNNPVQGGLYDSALGSWGDSHRCSTCNLLQAACPGHPGHIDLPIPVYHPVFLDQLYRLLRAQCRRCAGFRLGRSQLHRYASILRLLQHGLLREAQMIDAIGPSELGDEVRHMMVPDAPSFEEGEAEDEKDSGNDSIIRQRENFVKQAIRESRRKARHAEIRHGKHEGSLAMRREVIKEFLAAILKDRKCAVCQHISPTYRKDRFVKIFEKGQNPKEMASNAQANSTRVDALELAMSRMKTKRAAEDEFQAVNGVTEVDVSSVSGGSEDEGDGEDLDEMGGVVESNARPNGVSKDDTSQQRFLPTSEVRARLNLLFDKEQDLLFLLFNSKPQRQPQRLSADMFFLQTLLVPPNRYRPEAVANDRVQEAQQNKLYQNILKSASKVTQMARERQKEAERNAQSPMGMAMFYEACTELQDCVNSLIDNTKSPVSGQAAKRLEEGIKQKLEKKEGLFRKNMMGKRVNYAARSVISPDPNIDTNEIGVPPVFARKLTYPEPVTSHNFRDMQQAVINGPEKWPGAAAIESESGQIVNLGRKSLEDRIALANQLLAPTSANSGGARNKKVHRHISNGDVVLMNRQPTLHKPSIMGHRVRVLPGERTIRMHYANCNTYNADFDGDEMNMHFPQNEVARAEALQLADTDHQYISGTAGKPLRGLIQDHLSVSVALCNKDTFFDRDAYHQLVYSALRPEHGHIVGERLELVPPAVIKPVPRWTGKQVITTLLKNIRPLDCGDLWMNGSAKVKGDRWAKGSEEGQVMFRDGEFVCGILDKNQLGPESGGFIHAVHEVYGPSIASKLLSAMGRLLTKYLNMRAFTCGMDDLRMTPGGERDRKAKLEAAARVGLEVATRYVSLQEQNPKEDDPELLRRLEEVIRDDKKQEGLDLLMNQGCSKLSSEITATCLPAGLTKQFPKNHMQAMTTSGAKGGPVNANLISCNLGQQVLEGRRVPVMISGKTLPCFKPFDTNVRAGGYIVNRFLTGIRPQEYFFHLMAGREGLIDTAVKTSRSGYLQRCIIKGMEGLEIAYDSSVRDSDGSVCQFLYGEDGIDIGKQKYLKDFEFLLHNRDSQLAQTGYVDANGTTLFENKDMVIKQMKDTIKSTRGHRARPQDPVVSVLDPSRFAFATSETFFKAMTKYTKENQHGLIKEKGPSTSSSSHQVARKTAEKLFALKYLRSLVEPGEAVGIVAGQSIGEPSTQMTLNTFHLAGHSAKNVTLGIPRLREILMTASAKISTPSMTLVLNEELSHADGEAFARAISVLSLADVLDKATVREKIGQGIGHPLAKIYDVRLYFFPSSEYTKTYAIGIPDLEQSIQTKFLPQLETLIKKALKKASKGNEAATPEIGVKTRSEPTARTGALDGDGGRAGDDDEEEEDEDDDATNDKQRANRSEAVSYGPNDDDDDVVQKQMQEDVDSDAEGQGNGDVSPARNDDDDMSDEEGRAREDMAKSKHEHVTGFRFDRKKGERCDITLEFDASIPKLLMVVLVQEAIKKSLVQQIAGVRKCTFVPDEKIKNPQTGEDAPTPVIHTDGANLRAMQRYGDYINPNRIATNDIAAVLETYGVEACRANIVRELGGVFAGHGISVDHRHLSLIGDYMTRNGGFSPFNRMGLAGNISPFTKMSFETTLSFLKDAVLDGDWDDLNAPSSRLVVGRLGKVGTGLFDVYTNTPTRHLDTVHAAA